MTMNRSLAHLVVAVILAGAMASTALAQAPVPPGSSADNRSTEAKIRDLSARLAALEKEAALLREELEKLARQMPGEADATPETTTPAAVEPDDTSSPQDGIAVAREKITWLPSSLDDQTTGRITKRRTVLCGAPPNAARLALHLPNGPSVGRFKAQDAAGVCRITYAWTSDFGVPEEIVIGTAKIADSEVVWEVAEDTTLPQDLTEDARLMEIALQYAVLAIHDGDGDALATYQFVPAEDVSIQCRKRPVSTSVSLPMGTCEPVLRLGDGSDWKEVDRSRPGAKGLQLEGPTGKTLSVRSSTGTRSLHLVFESGQDAWTGVPPAQAGAAEVIDEQIQNVWLRARNDEMEARSSLPTSSPRLTSGFRDWPKSMPSSMVPDYLDRLGQEIERITARIPLPESVNILQKQLDQTAEELPRTPDGKIAWDLERDAAHLRAFMDYRRVERRLQSERERALGRYLARFPQVLAKHQESVEELLADKQALIGPAAGPGPHFSVIVRAGEEGAVLARIAVTVGGREKTP